MKIKALVIAISVSAAVASPLTMADNIRARNSFTADVTRTTSGGKSLTRQTVQNATANGFQRATTVTTGAGKMASRSVEASRDAASQTYTRTVDGVRAAGDTYSAERITQRTEDGFNRSLSRTNADGATASKQVDVSVNKDASTLTKNTTVTGFNGEVHSSTVVKTYGNGGAE